MKVIIEYCCYSPRMRGLQMETLGCVNCEEKNTSSLKTKYGNKVAWYEQLREVPRTFSFFLGKGDGVKGDVF